VRILTSVKDPRRLTLVAKLEKARWAEAKMGGSMTSDGMMVRDMMVKVEGKMGGSEDGRKHD